MSDDPVFVYAAVYADRADADADYDTLLDLHSADLVGTYEPDRVPRRLGYVGSSVVDVSWFEFFSSILRVVVACGNVGNPAGRSFLA